MTDREVWDGKVMKSVPEDYMGYRVVGLLQVLEEIQGGVGTKASEEKIKAMSELVREYKLVPVHQVGSGK